MSKRRQACVFEPFFNDPLDPAHHFGAMTDARGLPRAGGKHEQASHLVCQMGSRDRRRLQSIFGNDMKKGSQGD